MDHVNNQFHNNDICAILKTALVYDIRGHVNRFLTSGFPCHHFIDPGDKVIIQVEACHAIYLRREPRDKLVERLPRRG